MLEPFPITKLDKKSWPEALLEIPEPPEQLYVRGEMPDESYIRLAVVGARKFTSYGKEACRKLILGLQGYPVCIVSGLALGIDAISHEAALDARLPTIAIPGSGLGESVLHPKSNIPLAREILRKGGCMLSEFDPKAGAMQHMFPQRNRIMAGLSKAVLVIEAERRSGTLITARLATEYNRDVLTVPGSIFSSMSEGPTLLMRLGATPVATSEDILEALGIKTDGEDKQQKLFDDLSPDEELVYKNLSSPLSRDELALATKLPVQRLNMALTLLELKAATKESGGKVFRV
jgi:DNA processing protein